MLIFVNPTEGEVCGKARAGAGAKPPCPLRALAALSRSGYAVIFHSRLVGSDIVCSGNKATINNPVKIKISIIQIIR